MIEARAVANRAGAAIAGGCAQGPNTRGALLYKAAAALKARSAQFIEALLDELGAMASASTALLLPCSPAIRCAPCGSMRQVRCGICHINAATVHDEAPMPFGRVGASGHGRFGGKAGIDQFTELRWITMETQPGHYPI